MDQVIGINHEVVLCVVSSWDVVLVSRAAIHVTNAVEHQRRNGTDACRER